MLRLGLLLAAVVFVSSQYPQERAPQPPPHQGPPPQQYAPPPQASRSQSYGSDRSPQNSIFRPADVHYVNIGLELAGDYKFGYDTGKSNDAQSFREETRLPDGTVQGAYGYVDETGMQRVIRYTAGKDGFKAEGDLGPGGAPKAAAVPAKPARAAVQTPPQQSYAPPQQSYAPPQRSYAPPQPSYSPPPQAEYRPQPQQAYRPPPAPPAYSAPPASYPSRPRPQSYEQPQNYGPRPRPQPRPMRPAPPSYDDSPDYDNPNNEIGERRLAPVDTSLFNYNIGASRLQKN